MPHIPNDMYRITFVYGACKKSGLVLYGLGNTLSNNSKIHPCHCSQNIGWCRDRPHTVF